jgi:hypothetical protein
MFYMASFNLVKGLHVSREDRLVIYFCSLPFRPNMLQVISQTVELLVHACSSSDHHIRLSASENLKKMIKVCDTNNEPSQNQCIAQLAEDLG